MKLSDVKRKGTILIDFASEPLLAYDILFKKDNFVHDGNFLRMNNTTY